MGFRVVEIFFGIIGLLVLFGMLMANGKGTPHDEEEGWNDY
jgi:hypothetical protein